jgi:hypothetical protein
VVTLLQEILRELKDIKARQEHIAKGLERPTKATR